MTIRHRPTSRHNKAKILSARYGGDKILGIKSFAPPTRRVVERRHNEDIL